MNYSRANYDISKIDSHWADRQMVDMIDPGKTVLDVGCASGHFGKFLKSKGCVMYGIEIEPALCLEADRHYVSIISGDVENMDIPWTYDVIILSNILEHLKNPESLPVRLKSNLNKGGFFVIALPNVAHFSIRLKLLFGNFNPDSGILNPDHLHFYTFNTMKNLIETAGLKIVEHSFDYDKGIPKLNRFIPKWVYGLFPELFGFQFIFKCEKEKTE